MNAGRRSIPKIPLRSRGVLSLAPAVLVFILLLGGGAWGAAAAGPSGTSGAAAPALSLDQANRLFAERHYAEAAAGYQDILLHSGYSAPLLYNLGNADFRLGKLGDAVLNYERAQVLAPQDPDIAANLRFVRRASFLYAPEPPWYEAADRAISLNAWSYIASAGLFVLCAGALLLGLGSRPRSLAMALSLGGALALACAGTALFIERPALERAVVMTKDAAVRLSPFDTAQALFALPEGDIVRIKETHSGFARIVTREGRGGWVSLAQVRPVIARAAGWHLLLAAGAP